MSEYNLLGPSSDAIKLLRLIDSIKHDRKTVADYLGVNERTLYRWLSGDTKRVPRMVFIALQHMPA